MVTNRFSTIRTVPFDIETCSMTILRFILFEFTEIERRPKRRHSKEQSEQYNNLQLPTNHVGRRVCALYSRYQSFLFLLHSKMTSLTVRMEEDNKKKKIKYSKSICDVDVRWSHKYVYK